MNKYTQLSSEEIAKRTHRYAVQCAEHFQKLGRKLVKEHTPKIDFNSKSIEEIDMWIADLTTALGIRQFNK